MTDPTFDEGTFKITVSAHCRAPAATVYDLLADLRSHLEWGGRRHPGKVQRLVWLQAPDGPATVGVEFESLGECSSGTWSDRSRVTQATPPTLLEFVTEGTLEHARVQDQPANRGKWVHRYEITPEGDSCIVTYRLHQIYFEAPVPPTGEGRYRSVLFGVVIPSVIEMGIRNLVELAEQRASIVEVPEVASPATTP